MKKIHFLQRSARGQALITLLFFMVIAITITTASVVILFITMSNATKFEQGTRSYYIAESGVENALLRLLRDPSYVGETLSVGEGTATITVSGTTPYIIRSVGEIGNFQRTLQTEATYANGVLSVGEWREL